MQRRQSSIPRSSLRAPRWVRPDIVLPKYKTAIFVHGCFWHRHNGCKSCTTPTHRSEWWLVKLNGNAVRDKLHQAALKKLGWRVMVIVECEIANRDFLHFLLARLARGHRALKIVSHERT